MPRSITLPAPEYYTEAPKYYTSEGSEYYTTTYVVPAYYTAAPSYYTEASSLLHHQSGRVVHRRAQILHCNLRCPSLHHQGTGVLHHQDTGVHSGSFILRWTGMLHWCSSLLHHSLLYPSYYTEAASYYTEAALSNHVCCTALHSGS